MRKIKNPLTGQSFNSESLCIKSLEENCSDQLRSMGVTAKQVIYNHRNKYPIHNTHGKSVISGKRTAWNEKSGKYERFADESERAKYRQMFVERMKRVHGKTHLLDDPEHQRVMLGNRSISGDYKFSDGSVKRYTGKEELAVLQFLDTMMNWPGNDVHCPAPQNFPYKTPDNKSHWYIPDVWIESLNLIIEVKGEMHNGYRNRDIEIEHIKDAVLHTSGYNYVKVEDRNYADLIEAIEKAKSGN